MIARTAVLMNFIVCSCLTFFGHRPEDELHTGTRNWTAADRPQALEVSLRILQVFYRFFRIPPRFHTIPMCVTQRLLEHVNDARRLVQESQSLSNVTLKSLQISKHTGECYCIIAHSSPKLLVHTAGFEPATFSSVG